MFLTCYPEARFRFNQPRKIGTYANIISSSAILSVVLFDMLSTTMWREQDLILYNSCCRASSHSPSYTYASQSLHLRQVILRRGQSRQFFRFRVLVYRLGLTLGVYTSKAVFCGLHYYFFPTKFLHTINAFLPYQLLQAHVCSREVYYLV